MGRKEEGGGRRRKEKVRIKEKVECGKRKKEGRGTKRRSAYTHTRLPLVKDLGAFVSCSLVWERE